MLKIHKYYRRTLNNSKAANKHDENEERWLLFAYTGRKFCRKFKLKNAYWNKRKQSYASTYKEAYKQGKGSPTSEEK